MMTPSDEVYWSLPAVVVPAAAVAWWSTAEARKRLASRANAWLDANVYPPADRAPLSPCGCTNPPTPLPEQPRHVRVLPLEVTWEMELKNVDPAAIDLIWGGNGWRPYDWQVDGDAWPHT